MPGVSLVPGPCNRFNFSIVINNKAGYIAVLPIVRRTGWCTTIEAEKSVVFRSEYFKGNAPRLQAVVEQYIEDRLLPCSELHFCAGAEGLLRRTIYCEVIATSFALAQYPEPSAAAA